MAEEDLRYKIVLDASQLPSALEQVKSQINGALASSGGMEMGGGMAMPQMAAPAPMPVSAMEASSPSFSTWAQNTSESMKMGYYKASELAATANLMRKQTAMQITDYFDQQKSPVSGMDPIQLATASMGFGYDPYTNMQSKGEIQFEVDQRIADNQTFGMMDYGFGEMVGGGAAAGATIGGLFGVKGALIGAGIGSAAGIGAWGANMVMKPFASEASFRRNISRGLRDYSKYSVMGRTSFDERNDVAEMVADFDTSAEMVGTGTDRDDVKGMFDIAAGTNYLNTSTDMGDFKEKMRKFMQSYTKIQHIIGKTGADIGAFVDQMHESGLLEQFGGDMVGASSYIRGAGMGARLGVDQAMQVYSSGAEMVRGTGIDMGAGGSLLLNNLADTTNMLKNRELSPQDIAQLGGVQSAAAVLTRNAFESSTSPTGQALGFSVMDGSYSPGMNLSEAYMGGVSGIGGYSDYVKKMVGYNKFLGEGGADVMQMVDMSSKINLLKDANIIKDDMNSDEIAFVVSNQSKALFGRQMSLPEAKLMLANATRSEETIMAPFKEEMISLQQQTQGEKSSWFSRTSDNIGNFFTGISKGIGSWIDPGNTEITPDWMTNNSTVTTQEDIDALNPDKKLNSDLRKAGAELDSRYSKMTDSEREDYSKVESEVTQENFSRLISNYKGNTKAQEYVKIAARRKGFLAEGSSGEPKKYSAMDVVTDKNKKAWDLLVEGNRTSYGGGRVQSAMEDVAADLGYDLKVMDDDAIENLSSSFSKQELSSSIGKLTGILDVMSSGGEGESYALKAGEGLIVDDLQKRYKDMSLQQRQSAFFKDAQKYGTGVAAAILREDQELSKSVRPTKIGAKEVMRERFGEMFEEAGSTAGSDWNTFLKRNINNPLTQITTIGLSNFIVPGLIDLVTDSTEFDLKKDGRMDFGDVHQFALMSKSDQQSYITKLKDGGRTKTAAIFENIPAMLEADAIFRRTNSTHFRDAWSVGTSEILEKAKEANLGEKSIAEINEILNNGDSSMVSTEEVRERLKKVQGYDKIAGKISTNNFVTMDERAQDAYNLSMAAGGSEEQARLMSQKANSLAKQVEVASQLRTQIAPDGSITQARDMEQIQVTMADSLATMVKLNTGQLNVQRAILIASLKDDSEYNGDQYKSEIRTVLSKPAGA